MPCVGLCPALALTAGVVLFRGRRANGMAVAADALPERGTDLFQTKARRTRALGDGQRHHQHTVALAGVGELSIHRDRQVEPSVVGAGVPFVEQDLVFPFLLAAE